MAGFVLRRAFDLLPATLALFGGAALLLLSILGKKAEEQTQLVARSFEEVEWITNSSSLGCSSSSTASNRPARSRS
jgi:hypothetical protein